MSFLVIKLDHQFNILEASELSTHGLATQKAHELIEAGFCARITDKPNDSVAWFQELKKAPMLEEVVTAETIQDAPRVSGQAPLPLPLTSRVRIVHRDEYVPLSSIESELQPQKRRVIIRHG